MILIFYAFGRELDPFRRRLSARSLLPSAELKGYRGRLGETELVVVATGIGMRRASETARRALEAIAHPELVIMAGVAGALSDAPAVGHLVLANRIVNWRKESPEPESTIPLAAEQVQSCEAALRAARLDFSTGTIVTSNRVLATGAEKRAARERSGALAVDMESGMVAAEAARRGLPFACVRAILDTVDEELVAAALVDEHGRVRPLTAAREILRRPKVALDLARMARNMSRATHSLADALDTVVRAAY